MSNFVKDLIPEDVRLIETHEYVFPDDDRARVGISHHAAEALGDVVYVDLPQVGDTFEQGDTFGSIESVKAASDLYLPVDGEVIAVNTNLEDSPETVNDDCYDAGWMIEIKLTNPDQMQSLLTPQDYLASLDADNN